MPLARAACIFQPCRCRAGASDSQLKSKKESPFIMKNDSSSLSAALTSSTSRSDLSGVHLPAVPLQGGRQRQPVEIEEGVAVHHEERLVELVGGIDQLDESFRSERRASSSRAVAGRAPATAS